ncbi:Fis family transcriptional regulator [Shewanella olleyana]|uniref:Fis family transcriptional regulator n=1 Tax=Shewanella olleyana TaxID=135626 RepID=UPI00200EB7B0|nr:Fis family transcriptional regulator [Shewanella olleyana]MCL1066931.1 Fis family transcriptional regulator [Shewanella olleyana]
MKKSDKKIDNQIRESLTDVCDVLIEQISGFQWLTHIVNFNAFPQSLKVVCVFDNEAQLTQLRLNKEDMFISQMIVHKLSLQGISISSKQVLFDSEAKCEAQHNGNWALRLK